MKSRCFIALVFLTVGRKILPGYFWETVLFSDDWTKLLLASFEKYFQTTTTNHTFKIMFNVVIFTPLIFLSVKSK